MWAIYAFVFITPFMHHCFACFCILFSMHYEPCVFADVASCGRMHYACVFVYLCNMCAYAYVFSFLCSVSSGSPCTMNQTWSSPC